MTKKLDLTDKKFFRLTVIKDIGHINGRVAWRCLCDCGKYHTVTTHDLMIGDTKSCGCLKKDNKILRTHGDSKSHEYKSWTAMKDRCCGINHSSYNNYHGRGISICDRWIYSYENFLSDMGRKPNKKMSLDRIDNDGDYTPENCRWATIKQQNNNSRNCRLIEHDGNIKTMKQWSEAYGIGYKLLRDRICKLGWNMDKALSTKKRTIK